MIYTELVRAAARLATGILGWRPAEFWAATPAELQLALDGRFGVGEAIGQALNRDELQRLREKLGDG